MVTVEAMSPFPVADSSETTPWVDLNFSVSCEEVTAKGSKAAIFIIPVEKTDG
jgi:hypothetical protein